jgi:hypothetical protein
MEPKLMPQMLLISGTGRNSGKTTMACAIINKFSKQNSIIAIKISPHFYKNNQGKIIIMEDEEIYIEEELNPTTGKDSSLMLAAGALRSFFVMTNDQKLDLVLNKILSIVPENSCFVCESGGMRKWVLPGLFLVLDRIGYPMDKYGIGSLKTLADLTVSLDDKDLELIVDKIELNNKGWNFKLK